MGLGMGRDKRNEELVRFEEKSDGSDQSDNSDESDESREFYGNALSAGRVPSEVTAQVTDWREKIAGTSRAGTVTVRRSTNAQRSRDMSTNAKKLTNKVAVVTGSSKGIGAAIAKVFADEGASVVVNYSSSKADGEKVAKSITADGGKAIAVGANLSKAAEIAPLFAETKKAFGRLDILVNNAGIYDFVPLEKITAENFHKFFDLNVLGLLLSSQAAVREFDGRGGSIINMSSVVSTYAVPENSIYSGTKGAVDAITRSLAVELGPRKIRVNAIRPGMVETEGTRNSGITESDLRKQVEAQTPLGRIGQPRDIATMAVFLASDDSSWITGETFLVSGGLR